MKFQNIVCLFSIALSLILTSCVSTTPDNPGTQSAGPVNWIKVVSLAVEPAKPIALNPWRVTMKIKNISAQPLENVTYQFLFDGKGEQLGKGKIARLDPGVTVTVASESAKVRNGNYRVEGRVFLQNAQGEPQFKDYANQWMVTNVVVGQ